MKDREILMHENEYFNADFVIQESIISGASLELQKKVAEEMGILY